MHFNNTKSIHCSAFMLAILLAACDSGGGGSTGGGSTATGNFSVGGSLTGLVAGNKITLTNNVTDNLTLTADGPFAIATKLSDAAAYKLTVSTTTPLNQPCIATYGAGHINAANVTNLNAICGQPVGLETSAGTSVLSAERALRSATLLRGGKVRVGGGFNGRSASNGKLYF